MNFDRKEHSFQTVTSLFLIMPHSFPFLEFNDLVPVDYSKFGRLSIVWMSKRKAAKKQQSCVQKILWGLFTRKDRTDK